jgi:heme/copper-type cytochrome/quinol oxidase subunit 4
MTGGGVRPLATALAAAIAALSILAAFATAPLSALAHQSQLANSGQTIPGAVVLGTVGFLIARRQPRNAVGWLLLAAITVFVLATDAGLYVVLGHRPGEHLPELAAAYVLGYAWFVPQAIVGLGVLLFPDGRVPSPRWRWARRGYVAVVGCYALVTYGRVAAALIGHDTRPDAQGGLAAVDGGWYARIGSLLTPVLAAFWLSFVVAQVLSWRNSSGERRQQLKCLLAGAVALAVVQAILQPILSFGHLGTASQGVLNVISGLGFGALPAAVAVAILKYRLYDIDRIISRTLAYSIVTAVLAGLYAGLVLLATGVLDLTSQVAVAAATLAAAALFNPLRRRVQRAVDRRFNRARYDADNTVAAFAARLQDTTDPDAVRSDLIGTVHHALEPAHLSLWLTGAPR